ncbi:hypothetical protein PPV93_13915, partial [Staphylococcus aureus]|uniref:hypothetical protein n=1 Tax=Staphylococcus aureus TaxID=1280 RepID=UPI003D300910|nr:hypothetical protein [Staphylococcus aureus]
YQSPKWMGKCPNCGAWNQMEEIVEKAANPKHGVKTKELAGIMEILKHADIDLEGKNAVVIGRSHIVGQPV